MAKEYKLPKWDDLKGGAPSTPSVPNQSRPNIGSKLPAWDSLKAPSATAAISGGRPKVLSLAEKLAERSVTPTTATPKSSPNLGPGLFGKAAGALNMAAETPTGKEVTGFLDTWGDNIVNAPVLRPILSAAGALFNTLAMPIAGVRGGQYQQAVDNNMGLITEDDLRDAAFKKRKINGQEVFVTGMKDGRITYNIEPTVTDDEVANQLYQNRNAASAENATAWLQNRPTVYGKDLQIESGADATPGFLGISEAGRQGLVADIIEDPLNLIPVNGLVKVGKLTNQTVKGAYEGAKLASQRQVSESIAKKLFGEDAVTPVSKDLAGPPIETLPKYARYAGTETKAGKEIKRASELLDGKFLYKTSTVDEFNDASRKTASIIGSGLEAGAKALSRGIVSSNLDTFLRKYAAADVTRRGVLRTRVEKRSPTEYVVLSGNNEVLASANSLAEAKDKSNALRAGTSAEGMRLRSAKDLSDAESTSIDTFPAESNKESVKLPAEVEDSKVIELYEPYQAKDNKFYVYDGEYIRSFETAADAERFTEAKLYTEAETSVPEVKKSGKAWTLRVEDQVYTFKTKKEADTARASFVEGSIPVQLAEARSKASLIDEQPTPLHLAEIMSTPTKGKDAQALKTILKNLDSTAKKATGTRVAYKANMKSDIEGVITGGLRADSEIKVLRDLEPKFVTAVDDAIALRNDENPFTLYEFALSGKAKQILGEARVTLADGSNVKLSALIAKNVVWDKSPIDVRASALSAVQDFRTRITNAQSGPTGQMNASQKFETLKAKFGEDVANKIQETGILGPWKGKTQADKNAALKSYQAMIDSLLEDYQAVKFNGIEDLIDKAKSGVAVDEDSLKNIFKIMDPENTIISRVEKELKSDLNIAFYNELFKSEGIKTVKNLQIQLTEAGDFDKLLSLSNISDDLLLSQLLKSRKADDGSELAEFAAKAVDEKSKQAAAERLSDPVLGKNKDVAQSAIADANAESFARIANAMESPAGIETVDTFGKAVVRSTEEAYSEGSEAIQKYTFNQVNERKAFGSITGILRFRLTKNGAVDRKQLLDETIIALDNMEDSLALADMRTTYVKLRDDEDFVGAWDKAKSKKKKFDIKDQGHFVYLNAGDLLKTFKSEDEINLALDAFFPQNKKTKGQVADYLSMPGFADAARQALELYSKGKAIDVDQLAARILNGGLSPNKYSPAYRAKYKDIARKTAEHLAKLDVLEDLKSAHLKKSVAVSDQWINAAETMHDDLQRIMYEGWQMNLARGDMSDAARATLLRNHLRKLIYVTGVMKIEGGPIAASAIESLGNMFLKNGLIKTPESATDTLRLIDAQEQASFQKVINTFNFHEKPQLAMKPGQTKYPKPARVEKIQGELEEAKYAYQQMMGRSNEAFSSDPKVRKTFERDLNKTKAGLASARAKAIDNGISTEHWSTIQKRWIPSEKYNYKKEVQEAQRELNNYEAAKSGVSAREDFIADAAYEIPKGKKLTAKQKAAFLKQERAKLAEVHLELAETRIANAADDVESLLDQNFYEQAGFDEITSAAMYHQRYLAEGLVRNTQLRVDIPSPLAASVDPTDVNTYRGAGVYGTDAREAEGGISRFQRFKERGYGASGRMDVKAIQQSRETMQHKLSHSYSELTGAMSFAIRNISDETIDSAFTLVKNGDIPAMDASADLVRAYKWFDQAMQPLMASTEEAISTLRGYDGDLLAEMMNRIGIGEAQGFPSPVGLTPTELPQFYKSIPLGEFVPPAGVVEGTAEFRTAQNAFNAQKAAFKEKKITPLEYMTKLMSANQNIIFQKGLAEDFIANFGYKAQGLTFEQAKKAGYVELAEAFGEKSLLKYLPSAEQGGMVPPELGKQYFSMMREYNQLYNSRSAELMRSKGITGIFTTIGRFKATQTILMLPHHFTNFIGDSIIAMTRNVTNPADWGDGARLASKLAMRRAQNTYTKSQFGEARKNALGDPERIEKLFREFMRHWGEDGQKTLKGVTQPGEGNVSIAVLENGKPVRRVLSDDDISDLFERYGIFEESIYQEDIQGLVDEIQRARGGYATNRTFLPKIADKADRGFRKLVQIPGDFTAGYANIIRGAHALKLIRGRSWGSLDEAMQFAAREIALFHPTAKSLAATERQWGRFATTYYTWIRQAHMMTLRMLGENMRNVYNTQKVIFGWNREQLGEQNNPMNIGFGSVGGDPNMMPGYVTSAIGAIRLGPKFFETLGVDLPDDLKGKTLTANLPVSVNDVFNFWKLDIDPYNNPEENFYQNLLGTGGNGENPGVLPTIGKNISLLGEVGYKALYGRDPRSGKPIDINGTLDFLYEFGGAEIGAARILKAFDPEATEGQRALAGFRSIVGLGLRDEQSEANKRNAQNQFYERTRNFAEQIGQDMIDGTIPQNSVVADRIMKILEEAKENE